MTDLPATTSAEVPATHDPEKLRLMRDMCAKGATDNEFLVMMELASRYQLDPFSKQIWLIKYGDNPAQIFAGRDGYLAIAHRSGVFDGMKTGTRKEDNETIGWCEVHRKDMKYPFVAEVKLSEYSTGKNLWKDKPETMIKKVAQAQALRQAFNISGLYSPEEIDTGDRAAPRYVGEVPAATPNTCEVCGVPVPPEIRDKTRPHTPRTLCVECFTKWWSERPEAA